MPENKTISVEQLAAQDPSKIDLIDVRSNTEYNETHAAPARNIPADTLDVQSYIDNRGPTDQRPVYLVCNRGGRAGKVQQKFLDAGFENAINVEGGTQAWIAAGLPVVKSTPPDLG